MNNIDNFAPQAADAGNHRVALVASVHKYDREKKTLVAVNGAAALSPQANMLEGQYAKAWARNIWADTLL